MKINSNSFFDVKREFRYFNLNSFYLSFKNEISDPKNPEQIQNCLTSRLNLNIEAYGGYGEDRKDIWADTYMKETGQFIHLGIDINMPKGTKILAPFSANIIDRFEDKDTKIGWGGRLIIERNGKFLALGHINPDTLNKKNSVKQGEVLGEIGTWPSNGNTFEHLHIQVIKPSLNRIFREFDGYGFETELINNPNPFNIEF